MRTTLFVFLLFAAPLARAQSPEQAYIAARVQIGAVLEEKAKSADFYARVGLLGRTFVDIETEGFALSS